MESSRLMNPKLQPGILMLGFESWISNSLCPPVHDAIKVPLFYKDLMCSIGFLNPQIEDLECVPHI